MKAVVYRVPFSTNVERIALAAAHKRIEVDWRDVDAADRSEVVRVSGQELVPVLQHDGRVVTDSPVILRYLEEQVPEPPLWPSETARRAEADVFVDWFNRVWKRPPNLLAAELQKPEPDDRRVEELGREIAGAVDLFERLLASRDYLLGDDFGIGDVIAFPFLKFALFAPDERDGDPFHDVLHRWQPIEGHPRLEAWIRRVEAHPQA